MRGTVIKRGATWSVVIDLGRSEHTGKRERQWHSGFPTEKAAEKARTKLLRELDEGTFVKGSKTTLERFLLDEWLPAARATVRASTWAAYETAVRTYVVPHVGAVELQKLTPAHLLRLYAVLLENGRRDGRGLAPKTVRNIHGTLHRALKDAERWGKVQRNVADHADPPRWERPEMKTWTPEQLRAFLAHVRSDRLEAAWMLAATTGMRRGEILGLRWQDVDLDAGRVGVVQTLVVVNYELRISEPKTTKGRRSVALDPATVASLRAHRARQAQERLAVGAGWRDRGLVFSTAEGDPIHPERFSAWFAQHARRAQLPAVRLHDVRHTYATLALGAGIHPKIVSERLGHAQVSITLDTYSHVTAGMQEEAAAKVAAAIFGD